MKTIRFALVVNQCGSPEIYLPWVNPARDKLLKRALAENRVMTLHQELHGGKKDFGTVGYLKDRHGQIVLFPKSLRRFVERRIVAVDYSLLAKGGSKEKTDSKDEGIQSPAPSAGKTGRKKPEFSGKENHKENDGDGSPKHSPAPATPQPHKVEALSLVAVTREIMLAVNELDAGKSVPAYKRLERLLARLSD